MGLPVATLKKGEGRMLKAGGLWIFDNEIAAVTEDAVNGELIAVQEQITAETYAAQVGHVENVLCEGVSARSERQITGRTQRGITVNFDGSADMVGSVVPVMITGAGHNTLKGKIAPAE